MDNDKRLAAWRKKNQDIGAPASAELATSGSTLSGAAGAAEDRRTSAASDRLDEERRRAEDLLPTSEDLVARRAANAEKAYRSGRVRLLKVALFALLPVVAGILYLGIFAPQFYASESTFTVSSTMEDGGPSSGGSAALGGISFTDGYRVKEYLLSGEALAALNREEDFIGHFGDVEPAEALEFYRDRIDVTVDQQERLISLVVAARSARESVQFANALLALAQEKVRSISNQINQDQLASLQEEEAKAEARLNAAVGDLQAVQISRSEIDPRRSAETIFSIINELETDLSEQEAQREALLANGLNESPLLPRINARIAALRSQIERQGNRMVEASSSDTVQRSIALYDAAVARQKFAETALKAARETLDRARLRGLDQRKYLIVIAQPMLPQEVEQSRLLKVLLVLAALLTLYIILSYLSLRRRYLSDD